MLFSSFVSKTARNTYKVTTRRLHQLPVSAMLIDDVPITPAMHVRDLGIYLDGDLSMRTHVQRTVSRCFAALHQLRQIRHSVPTSTSQTLVVALIHSRLDYGNSVLVGLPVYLMRRLVCSQCGSAAYLPSPTLRSHQ